MKCQVHPESDAVDKCYICGQPVCGECRLDFDGKAICKACAIPLSRVYASICAGAAGALESRVKIIDDKNL
jgi:predicted amidophosphoribosyltransferase